jgi:hypothetical protein
MLSIVTLNVIMMSVIMLNVIMLNAITLNVAMLNVIMLNVVAPFRLVRAVIFLLLYINLGFFAIFSLPVVRDGIRTLDLGIMSRMVYHIANMPKAVLND